MADQQQWQCQRCGFEFDPAEGDADSDVEPGVAFEDLPAEWSCPVCGAEQTDFRAR